MEPECWSENTNIQIYNGLGILNIFLSIFGTATNIIIILVYWQKRSQNQFLMIIALAFCDLLLSAVLIPLEAITAFSENWDRFFTAQEGMVACISLWFSLTTLSVYMLLLMTIERFIAIRFPFSPLKRRTLIGWMCVTVLNAMATFVYYFIQMKRPSEQIYHYEIEVLPETLGFIFNFILPAAVNVVLYCYIFSISRIQRERIRKQMPRNSTNKLATSKKIMIYHYVMILFCVTWLPFTLFNAYTLIDPAYWETCTAGALDIFTATLIQFNAVLNGLVYSSVSKTFREKAKRVLRFQDPNRVTFSSTGDASFVDLQHKDIPMSQYRAVDVN